MSLETDLYTYLTAISAITDIISTRLYPDTIPQNTDYPAAVYQRQNGERVYSLKEYEGIQSSVFVFNLFSETAAERWDMRAEFIDALDDYSGTMGTTSIDWISLSNDVSTYEPAARLFRAMVDFKIDYREA